ncbi:MAG: nuclear transport factor 2 family protein [Bacteroidota bacterium]
MKKIPSICFLLFLGVSTTQAQDRQAIEAAVIAPIKQLFEGMAKKDTTLIKAVFHPMASLHTASTDKSGKAQYQSTEISRFITSIGKMAADQSLEERILEYQVKVDGPLAVVWTPYEFYFNEKFSHCGVNAFTLFKSEDTWLITAITDTRRRKGCEAKK